MQDKASNLSLDERVAKLEADRLESLDENTALQERCARLESVATVLVGYFRDTARAAEIAEVNVAAGLAGQEIAAEQ